MAQETLWDDEESQRSPTISATELGAYARPRFCSRCAWVRLHVKNLPYQSFPGIFSSIDRYNKLVVHNHFDREHAAPSWLAELGESGEYVNPPHWSKFKILDGETGITLRGEADGIFKLADGSYAIVDYKTSRYDPDRPGMFPNYEVQLNAYAVIAERLGLSPVSKLALVYMEPVTDKDSAQEPGLVDQQGFVMGFRARVVPVDLRPAQLLPPLLRKARSLWDMADPPAQAKDCKDCAAVTGLIGRLGGA
ncbi:MAG: PD-(D/E)XK nuclease family protein [Chloroflexi bacterium]|nr:PD-(D/E)XK nuclease family protein [Chloroflexota bacterium]MDA1271750.1 PD-(D/E)XK nuclease family protein [Chloroflexota bacterium]